MQQEQDSNLSGPASNTRRRKGSDKNKIEEQSQHHEPANEVSVMTDNNYVEEVLHNPANVSSVNIMQIDKTDKDKEAGSVNASQQMLRELQTDPKQKRRSVGQLILEMENRSPIGSPTSQTLYKSLRRENKSSTPRAKLVAEERDQVAEQNKINMSINNQDSHAEIETEIETENDSQIGELTDYNHHEQEQPDARQYTRQWVDGTWNQPPSQHDLDFNTVSPVQESWSSQEEETGSKSRRGKNKNYRRRKHHQISSSSAVFSESSEESESEV